MPNKPRTRRTKQEMAVICDAMYGFLEADHPSSVRHVFYQLIGAGLVAKDEGQYSGTVVRKLTDLRRSGVIPYAWLSDATRWVRRPAAYDSIEEALAETARLYRRRLWTDAPIQVEVWCEKEAIAGILHQETAKYDIPLMVQKGYASHSYLYSCAEAMTAIGKPAFIYYFGDSDGRGKDIQRFMEQTLREYAPSIAITVERLAVTEEQIEHWHLPDRPPKTKDKLNRKHTGKCVEVDTIEPRLLRSLVRDAIEQHIDDQQLATLIVAERSERAFLRQIAADAEEGGRR
ncbi:MAG: hypothetical protein AB7R89_11080 [Dehalococcoidia bacterium]